MNELEDHWTRITASAEYNSADDDFKEKLKQRFFERTIGASEGYKNLPGHSQQKVRERFEERIHPSVMSKIKKEIPAAVEAGKEGATAGLQAAKTTLESPVKLQEVSKPYTEAAKRELVSGLKRSGVKNRASALQHEAAAEKLPLMGKFGEPSALKENVKAAVDIGKSTIEEGAGTIAELLPGSIAEAGLYEAAGGALELAGKTAIGKVAKTALTYPIGEGYGEAVAGAAKSFIAKFRGLKELPPVRLSQPFRGLLDDEKAYQAKLQEMAGMNGNPLYEPFTPEYRTNVSQLHEARHADLINLRAEEPHLKKLAQAEEDTAYQKKLESMPGADKKQPPLIPFKQMLQPGQEGKLMGKPQPKPGVSDIIKPEVRHTLENIAAEDKPKQPFMEESWKQKAQGEGVDPDVKKFRERNLSDITQKPLRNLLKEINDDLGRIGSMRFGPSDEDPAVLEAAKDLRVAVKLPSGSIFKDKIGADSHSQVAALAATMEGAVEGFWDELTKKFYSREDSAKMLGWSDQRIKQSGGLMAQNLRDLHSNWQKLGEKGSISLGGGNEEAAGGGRFKDEKRFIDDWEFKIEKVIAGTDAYEKFIDKLSSVGLWDKPLPEKWAKKYPFAKTLEDLHEESMTYHPKGEVKIDEDNFLYVAKDIYKSAGKDAVKRGLGEKGEVSLGGEDDNDYKRSQKLAQYLNVAVKDTGTGKIHLDEDNIGMHDAILDFLKQDKNTKGPFEPGFVDKQTGKWVNRDEALGLIYSFEQLKRRGGIGGLLGEELRTLKKNPTNSDIIDAGEVFFENDFKVVKGGFIGKGKFYTKDQVIQYLFGYGPGSAKPDEFGLGESGQIRIGAGGRKPVKAVGQDDYDVLNSAKDLRVAIRVPDGQIAIGDFGDAHVNVYEKNKQMFDKYGNDLDLGFYNNKTKEFMSREAAASYVQPKVNSLSSHELGDLHRAGTTYLGKSEKGLHSEDIAKIKDVASTKIIKQINKEFGEKGHVWGDADPERYDRIKQNVRELLRRANKVGYDATDEVLDYARRNYVSNEELHFIKGELATEDAPLDPRPLSEYLQAGKGSVEAKNTLWEKVKDRWTPDGTASKVKTLLTKRYGEIAEGHVDSQYFIHNTFKQLTKTEKEAMSFKGIAPEPGKLRWPNAQEIMKLISKPTENMKKAEAIYTKYVAEAHNFLSENFDDVGYVKDYVTQLWDKAHDVLLNPKANAGGTYNPFIENRTFPNYAAGINAGQQPKTLDISEIVSIYDKYKIKTVANVRFFDELAKMPTPQGLPAVMDAKRAPIGWIKANNIPALIGKRVHPDYLQAIKVISDAPFSNKALRAYDLLSETQRYASLTGSPFHFGSLFVVGSLSTDVPFKIPLKVLSATGKYIMKETLADESERSVWGKVLNAYKNGNAAFIDLPFSKRAVRAGLNIGTVGREQTGGLEGFLSSTEAKLNRFYMGKGIKAIRDVKGLFDKALWDYVHAGMKIMTFQEHLIDNMKKFPEMPIQELERKTASYVNDLDGGEAWETLFVSPQYQKSLHRLFFFPDWMVSRLRSLGEAFKPVGLDSIKNATTRSPEAYQAQKFWLRAGMYYYTFANWRNYVNTKKAYGTGRIMLKNDPGKEMDVFSHVDEHGRAIYSNFAPSITEVFKWFQDPVKALGTRFNPNLNAMAEYFTGTTLSGYKLPENKRGFTDIVKRHMTPITFGGSNEYGLYPKSKGMSSYEVVKRFEKVITNGDDPSIALQFGTANGYDVEKLYNVALRNVKGKMKKEELLK